MPSSLQTIPNNLNYTLTAVKQRNCLFVVTVVADVITWMNSHEDNKLVLPDHYKDTPDKGNHIDNKLILFTALCDSGIWFDSLFIEIRVGMKFIRICMVNEFQM